MTTLRRFSPASPATPPPTDAGAHYKHAEIGIKTKVADAAGFFRPGYLAPFNPDNAAFSLRLIKLFGNVVPLLDVNQGSVVVDTGSGYSWTTEWLFKSGVEAIGVDICRTYLEIAVAVAASSAFPPFLSPTKLKLNHQLHFAADNAIPVSTPQMYLGDLKVCDEDTDLGLRYTLGQLAPEVVR